MSQGTYTFANGDQFVGEFNDGMISRGTMTYANGSKYVGEFKFDLPHGQGTLTYVNGDLYEGDFVNGQIARKNTASAKNQSSKKSSNPAYDECMKLVEKEERELEQTRTLIAILSLNKNNNVSKGIADADREEKEIRRMKQQCICYLNESANCSTIYLDKDISIGIN